VLRALALAYRSTDSVDALSLDHPSVRGLRPAFLLPVARSPPCEASHWFNTARRGRNFNRLTIGYASGASP
jgi:hypothetical protein